MKPYWSKRAMTFDRLAILYIAPIAVLMMIAGPLHATLPADTLYVTNSGSNSIGMVDEATGAVSPFVPGTAGLDEPFGIVFAPNHDLYVANQGNGTISQITLGGVVTGTFATIGSLPDGMAVNSAGDLFAANFGSGTISEVPTTGPDAGQAITFASDLGNPTGVAFSPNGTLYVAVESGDIYTLSTSGSATLYTFVGTNTNPTGMAFDSQSNLYVSLLGPVPGEVFKYTSPSAETTFAGNFNDPEGLAFDSDGNLIVADLGNGSGGANSSNEITIVDSSGAFVENISGFADPAYMVDVSIPEPSPWVALAVCLPGLFLIGRSRKRHAG